MAESDAVAELRRWDLSGGEWRVLTRTPDRVVVELFTCDGGTRMGEVSGTPAEFADFLGGRLSRDAGAP